MLKVSAKLALVLGTCLAGGFAPPVLAQTADGVNSSADIIVNARRKEERLQDVPKTVNAVTASDLAKNNIQNFNEIASIVPGITLEDSGNGLVQNGGMRGASFDIDSGLPSPTVQFYLNDANVAPDWVFQSLYDIGQVEVLYGPQGTLRGRSAPSGSITITTKLPDLYKWGGYVAGTFVSAVNGAKEDYALNAPLIPGKLAVRIAGTVNDNRNNNIRNVNPTLYPTTPYDRTRSERVSVRAEPIDSLEINLEYQRTRNHELDNLQTESICAIDSSIACDAEAGNSQRITASDRQSTVNGQRVVSNDTDIWNARVDWHILDQKISYVGQYALSHLSDEEPEDGANWFNDQAGVPGSTVYIGLTPPTFAPGPPFFAAGTANPYDKIAVVRSQYQSHEARIANETRIAGLFDYVAGFNTVDARTNTSYSLGGNFPTSVLASSLATGGLPVGPLGRSGNIEISYFGNLTVHPTPKLEISAGARHILDKILVPSATNPSGVAVQLPNVTHTIWTASASYHFTPDVMAYVNAGSAFRQGGANLGLQDGPEGYGAEPLSIEKYAQISPETSTSYEVGVKTQLLDRKLTLNLDYYHQDYKNYQYISPDYIFFDSVGAGGTQLIPPIALGTVNVPAKVDGVEGTVNYRFARDGNIGFNFSYADGRITGGNTVPCTGSLAVLLANVEANGGPLVNTCPGGPTSDAPRLTGTAHVDYAHPLSNQVTGVLRGQVSFYGASPTDAAASPYDKTPAYALVNVYAGIRSPSSNWELTLFIKNLFYNETKLATYGGNINASTGPQALGYHYPYGPTSTVFSNYVYIATPPPREIGVTLKYAFGSR